MSIIEKALKNLQDKRAGEDGAIDPQLMEPYMEGVFIGRGRRKIVWAGALVTLAVAGVGMWFILNRIDERHAAKFSALATSFNERSALPVSAKLGVAPDKDMAEMPAAVDGKKGIPSSSIVETDTAAPDARLESEEAGAIAQLDTLATRTSDEIAASAFTGTEPETVARLSDDGFRSDSLTGAVMEPGAVGTAADGQQSTSTSASPSPGTLRESALQEPFASIDKGYDVGSSLKDPPWITAGMEILNSRGIEEATEHWANALGYLPFDRLVMVISAYRVADFAERILRRLSPGHAAFIVKGNYKSHGVYYLMTAPGRENLENERLFIQSALNLESVRGNRVEVVLSLLNTEGPAYAAVEESAVVEDGAVAKKNEMTPIALDDSAIEADSFGMETQAKATEKVKPEGEGNPAAEEAVSAPEVESRAPASDSERLEQTKLFIKEGRYTEAVELLQPLFINPPEDWEHYYLLGVAQLGLGELDKADRSFMEGLAREGSRPQLWVQRAVVAQQKNKNKFALTLLLEAEKIAPDMPEVQINIGYSHDMLGNTKEALRAYRSFIAFTEGKSGYVHVRRKILNRITVISD